MIDFDCLVEVFELVCVSLAVCWMSMCGCTDLI
jgi:hypothetical protein